MYRGARDQNSICDRSELAEFISPSLSFALCGGAEPAGAAVRRYLELLRSQLAQMDAQALRELVRQASPGLCSVQEPWIAVLLV